MPRPQGLRLALFVGASYRVPEWAREIALRRGVQVLSIRTAGEPVAFAQLAHPGRQAEITEVYVDARHRGAGLGTALTRAAIESGGDIDDLWICADDEDRAKELAGADFELVSHTDQGSQYASEDYTQQLDDAKVLASVGSVGDCYDNALAESFVDSYKTELIADRVWRSHAQLELATVDYVAWFNTRWLHSSLENVPPVEHEQRHVVALAAHPEALLLPHRLCHPEPHRSVRPLRGRLRPTGQDDRTNKIELLTRPTN